MKIAIPEHLLAAPFLLYVPAVAILRMGGLPGLAGIGLLVGALPLAGAVGASELRRQWIAPVTLAFMLVLVGLLLVSLPTGYALPIPVAPIFAGTLLGLPIAALGELVRPENSAGSKFLLLSLLFVEGLAVLAANAATPGLLATKFLQSVALQATGLGAWSGGAAAPGVPLSSVADPWFLGFGLLALAGGVSAFLRPPVGADSIPAELRRDELLIVLAALGGAAAFEVLALARPTYTLFGLALAMLLTVGSVILCTRRRAVPRSGAAALPLATGSASSPP